MADELIIEGLRISGDGDVRVVVDVIIETNFGVPRREAAGLSITEICQEIERLCGPESFRFPEAAAVKVVDGLLERFPRIEGLDLTIRHIKPQLPGVSADSVGARRRRRRAAPAHRLPRRVIKPLPQ